LQQDEVQHEVDQTATEIAVRREVLFERRESHEAQSSLMPHPDDE